MAVKVLLDFVLKPDTVDEVLKVLDANLPDTRSFDGCLGIEVLIDKENPNHIIMDEKWESVEHQQKYMKWREETGFTEQMMAVLDGPLEIKYFDIGSTL